MITLLKPLYHQLRLADGDTQPPLDYETKHICSVIVEVHDREDAFGHADHTLDTTIVVADVDLGNPYDLR